MKFSSINLEISEKVVIFSGDKNFKYIVKSFLINFYFFRFMQFKRIESV